MRTVAPHPKNAPYTPTHYQYENFFFFSPSPIFLVSPKLARRSLEEVVELSKVLSPLCPSPPDDFLGSNEPNGMFFKLYFFFSSFYLIVQYRGERASWHAMRGVYDFFFYWPSLLLAYCCCWTRIAKMFHLHRRIRLHGSQLKLAPVAIYFPCPAQLLLLPFFFFFLLLLLLYFVSPTMNYSSTSCLMSRSNQTAHQLYYVITLCAHHYRTLCVFSAVGPATTAVWKWPANVD